MSRWQHFHECGSGAMRAADGVHGVVLAAGPLRATVAWETGELAEVEQHDPQYVALGDNGVNPKVVMERYDFWRAVGSAPTPGREVKWRT